MRVRRALIAVLGSLALAPGAGAARAEGWHSAQPAPPPSTEGGIGVPVALGHIGDISFWAPNRGLLITAGTDVVPAGLYYYNGVAWRELSNVCGGAEGRIAWAGEDDFWTISDMQSGHELGGGSSGNGRDRSICHFLDGRVVASFAEPLGAPDSYQPMDAAACDGPDDCWFGGEALLSGGVNVGAFHLHWDGTTMTELPSLETPEPQLEDPVQGIGDLVFYKGRFYESAQQTAPGESPVHEILEGAGKPFVALPIEGPPEEAFHSAGGAFRFSEDSSDLWAVSSRSTAIKLGAAGQFQQLNLKDPGNALAGAEIGGVAAEPGSGDAWVSIDRASGVQAQEAATEVARLSADGTVEPAERLPQPGEDLARKGNAEVIDCPAAGDCWVATNQGWLFHLGSDQPEDHNPDFESLITYRPPDASVAFLPPETFPEDDSEDNPPPLPAIPTSPPHESVPMVRAPLFSDVSERLVGPSTLSLSFTLATRSRVRLIARRKRRTVARTPDRVLARGRHTLKLRLRRDAWPTKLDLQVHALARVPLVPAGSTEHEAIGGPTAVATSRRR